MKSNLNLIIVALISGAVFFGFGFLTGKHFLQKELEKKEAEEIGQQKTTEHFSEACSEESAEINLKHWMDFNYPDWKIYGDIKTATAGDCTYNLRFSTINPHHAKLGLEEKEIIVVQLSYINDFNEFIVIFLRGALY